MKTHRLIRQQWLGAPLEAVFGFFCNAENLEAITPPWLGFRIRTPLPVQMEKGTRIDYRLRLAGIPLGWRTRISEWDPPHRFVDLQERGPYARWEHTHRFEPLDGGVLMTDEVHYALPFGTAGRLAHALGVRAALAAIFDHRFAQVAVRFPGGVRSWS